jgi:hypothetical protein
MKTMLKNNVEKQQQTTLFIVLKRSRCGSAGRLMTMGAGVSQLTRYFVRARLQACKTAKKGLGRLY